MWQTLTKCHIHIHTFPNPENSLYPHFIVSSNDCEEVMGLSGVTAMVSDR